MSLLNGLNSVGTTSTGKKQLQEEKATAQGASNYMSNLNIGTLLNGTATPPTQEASSSRL